MTMSQRRWPTWAAAAVLVLSPLTLAPHFASSTELAKLRNSMVFDEAPRTAFDFDPTRWPADFLLDHAAPEPYFIDAARPLQLNALTDDWSRALAISRHLLASQPRLSGSAIQAPLEETHRRIVQRGEGYCADFVRAFQALAATAGMPMRAWAFSFDGYGGHGHIVVEIWNRQQQRWQMLDLFNNVYYAGADGQALGALAVRDGYLMSPASMHSLPLVPQARPGFRFEAKLREYYQRGLQEWYLWWGNNPFDYESAQAVRWLHPASRALAQLGGIAQGVQPRAVALITETNAERRAPMRRLAWQIRIVAGLVLLSLAVLVWQSLRRRAERKAVVSAPMTATRHAR